MSLCDHGRCMRILSIAKKPRIEGESGIRVGRGGGIRTVYCDLPGATIQCNTHPVHPVHTYERK